MPRIQLLSNKRGSNALLAVGSNVRKQKNAETAEGLIELLSIRGWIHGITTTDNKIVFSEIVDDKSIQIINLIQGEDFIFNRGKIQLNAI